MSDVGARVVRMRASGLAWSVWGLGWDRSIAPAPGPRPAEPVWSGAKRTLYRQPRGQQSDTHIECVAAERAEVRAGMGSAERTVLKTSSLRGRPDGRAAACSVASHRLAWSRLRGQGL